MLQSTLILENSPNLWQMYEFSNGCIHDFHNHYGKRFQFAPSFNKDKGLDHSGAGSDSCGAFLGSKGVE